MSSSEPATKKDAVSASDGSLKLAVAISILRSKLLEKKPSLPDPISESDSLRWKRKAKERKQEILRLRDDLKEAEDASQCDLFPQSASCKCYFFDNLGEWRPKQAADGSDRRFNDVIRRRFLRQVRLNERRRRNQGDNQRRSVSDLKNKDETEQLRASVDFLVELCESGSPVEESNFANWSHQAVDFILASMKNILSKEKDMEIIEGIVSSLVMRLVGKMCLTLQANESLHTEADAELYIQHVIRKLGSEAYIGHRVILSISQRISVLAESLLFLDPFDNAFPHMHERLFTMIQLIEFLVSDNLTTWSVDEDFDHVLFEEWLASVLHARKTLQLMESRNGLYVLYMDRVTGELAKRVSHIPSLQNINSNIHENLFC